MVLSTSDDTFLDFALPSVSSTENKEEKVIEEEEEEKEEELHNHKKNTHCVCYWGFL